MVYPLESINIWTFYFLFLLRHFTSVNFMVTIEEGQVMTRVISINRPGLMLIHIRGWGKTENLISFHLIVIKTLKAKDVPLLLVGR